MKRTDAFWLFAFPFTGTSGDVNHIMTRLPPPAVHAVFLGAIAMFAARAWVTIHTSAKRSGEAVPVIASQQSERS
jgi:hypothetical protein